MKPKYEIERSLASGSTGKVKLARHLQKTYAIKIINKSMKDVKETYKEIKIHTIVKHKNIISLVDHYEDNTSFYIVMDLAEMELFDLIEPDDGLHPVLTHFYFRQLLSAVRYLHTLGIVHRDIKPENIMLSKNGDLKLTDFGYSTVFMYKGKKRTMNTVAGSYCYMAPEIMEGFYDERIDIWSMGVLLIVLFTGIMPWHKPSLDDDNYSNYVQMKNHKYSPFNRLSPVILKLIEWMCAVNVNKRISISQLHMHEWVIKKSIIEDETGMCRSKNSIIEYLSPKLITRSAFTQPERINGRLGIGNIVASVPMIKTFDLPMLKRIYIKTSKSKLLREVKTVLGEMLISCDEEGDNIHFQSVDKQGNEIVGEAFVDKITDTACVAFTRIRGDCLEFKRLFNILYERFMDKKL